MRSWNLTLTPQTRLTLAADARLCIPNYCDDQIWELSQSQGEPGCLALQTTYGLRALKMLLFPRFWEGDTLLQDPAEFALPITVRYLHVNYVLLTFSPFPDIDAQVEYWVPASNAIAGRVHLTNQGNRTRQVRMEWAVVLHPNEEGFLMRGEEIKAANVLCGKSGDLAPLLLMSGGAVVSTSPYPSLVRGFELQPGMQRQVVWCLATTTTSDSSFGFARQILARNWEAEHSRIELLNRGLIEIITGNDEWDLAFSLAQKVAYGLFLGPTAHMLQPSFVITRQPDQGYTRRGDGSDYGPLWNGQTALEAYYLAELLLPASPQLAQGLVRNFIATLSHNGFVDWKPGLGGQRGNYLATPLLASLAWRIYQTCQDQAFISEVFPSLLAFTQTWFSLDHDRNGDGSPEWNNPQQAGLDDQPLFDRWHAWAGGLDISTVESPALNALLYKECQSLNRIAQLLGYENEVKILASLMEKLQAAIAAMWDEHDASYHYQDRDAHGAQAGEILGTCQGNGLIIINKSFQQPVRLVFHIKSASSVAQRLRLFIQGEGVTGHHRIERIPNNRFHWSTELGTAASDRTYALVEYVEVQGLNPEDQVRVSIPHTSFRDYTTMLPLWAGAAPPEHVKALVENALSKGGEYWQEYGIPAYPEIYPGAETTVCQSFYLPWVNLIAQGLVAYGYRAEAADLVMRVMKAITQTLKNEGTFRRLYCADSGNGLGERDALGGLAPVGLFLEVLGVRLINPFRLELTGFNPFPFPVTVKYRGLTVERLAEKSMVTFPTGQTVTLSEPQACVISLE